MSVLTLARILTAESDLQREKRLFWDETWRLSLTD